MITGLFLAAGIAMLFSGGDLLVRGASGIARALRVSPLIIGLTIVAFGTSAPELVVNVVAVLQGNPHVAFGN
ncbi:MAG TPA: calcium/sodium antiporter, partial [Deltaproteobacteria bacterium]|nr:calcium/sodium antiporter [Deltaproteobacteria bacterium]